MGSTNGESITEFEDEEDHEVEEYYSIQLNKVASPKQGARWEPDYRMSTSDHTSLKTTHKTLCGYNAR